MILVIEIGLFVMGIVGLVRGQMTVAKGIVVRGVPARLLALVALAPMPLSFAFGFATGIFLAMNRLRVADYNWVFVLGEVAITLICLAIVVGVGTVVGSSQSKEFEEDERRDPRRRLTQDIGSEDEPAIRSRVSRTRELETPAALPAELVVLPVELPPVVCGMCGTKLKVPMTLSGLKVRCAKCKSVLIAPTLPTLSEVPSISEGVSIETGISDRRSPQFPSEPRTEPTKPIERRSQPRAPSARPAKAPAFPAKMIATTLGVCALIGVCIYAVFLMIGVGQELRPPAAPLAVVVEVPKRNVEEAAPNIEAPKVGPEKIPKMAIAAPPPPDVEFRYEEPKRIEIELKDGVFQTSRPILPNMRNPKAGDSVRLLYEWFANAGECYRVTVSNAFSASLALSGAGIEISNRVTTEMAVLTPREGKILLTIVIHSIHEKNAGVTIRKIGTSDPLPIESRMPTADGVRLPSLTNAKRNGDVTSEWTAAVCLWDRDCFWTTGKNLRIKQWIRDRESQAIVIKGEYSTSLKFDRFGVDRTGRLYAQGDRIDKTVKGFVAGAGTPEDILVWDGLPENAPNPRGAITPMFPAPSKKIPLGGTISRFVNSPDGSWLYFLDVKNQKLWRIDPERGELDKHAGKLSNEVTSFCVTPNGKTIYCCTGGKALDVVDTATFEKVRTIELDHIGMYDVSANDKGILYLAGSPSKEPYRQNLPETYETNAFVVDLNRLADPSRAKTIPFEIEGLVRFVAFLPDQKNVALSSNRGISFADVVEAPAVQKIATRIHRIPRLQRAQQFVISPDGKFLLTQDGMFYEINP